MGRGPFNNRDGSEAIQNLCPQHAKTMDDRGTAILYEGLDNPGNVFDLDPHAMESQPGDQLVGYLALMEASTVILRGGVCEKFSSVVMGLLSMNAPEGTIACKIQWSKDHHYIVLCVGTSQWWVADPWPHNAFVVPWRRNAFPRRETK
ncbi:MAG: hypothetical protein MUE60_12725, partial [Candidatus Eisenbacteria bacterium]|nr:hypothetical protein [Candidatus Eisenbacteria bacterium]